MRFVQRVSIAVVAAVALSFSASAFAAPSFGGGLRLGPTVSQFGGEDADGSSARVGYSIHLVTELATHPFFAIQLEIGYTERGETRRYALFGREENIDTRLRYLEVPLMARLQVPAIVVAPYIEAGPYVSFLLDADVVADNASREVNDGVHDIDFGLGAGAGIIVDAKVLSVIIGARFTRGVTPVVDSGSAFGYELSDPAVYNQSFSIHAGLGF